MVKLGKGTNYRTKETDYVTKETDYVTEETCYLTKKTEYVTKETDYVDLIALRLRCEVGESDFLKEMPAILRHPPVAGGVPEDHFNN